MKLPLKTLVLLGLPFAGLVAVHAQSAYYDAVTALNPVAYWPLTETTAPPATAPVLTNLGSLGAAYNASINNSVFFGESGALAGSADTADGFDGQSASASVPYGPGTSPANLRLPSKLGCSRTISVPRNVPCATWMPPRRVLAG